MGPGGRGSASNDEAGVGKEFKAHSVPARLLERRGSFGGWLAATLMTGVAVGAGMGVVDRFMVDPVERQLTGELPMPAVSAAVPSAMGRAAPDAWARIAGSFGDGGELAVLEDDADAERVAAISLGPVLSAPDAYARWRDLTEKHEDLKGLQAGLVEDRIWSVWPVFELVATGDGEAVLKAMCDGLIAQGTECAPKSVDTLYLFPLDLADIDHDEPVPEAGETGHALDASLSAPTDIFEEPELMDRVKALLDAMEEPDSVPNPTAYVPGVESDERLRKAIAHYKRLARTADWRAIDESGVLEPGAEDARVPLLAKRLRFFGDLSPEAYSGEAEPGFDYGPALVESVKRFQGRHGLTMDGIIGKRTWNALNVSPAERARLLEVNLERRARMPKDLGKRYVFVNTADYTLQLIDQGKSVHAARTQVGVPYLPTPDLSHEISYLVFNPYWNLSHKAIRLIYLERFQNDPNYVKDNDFEILDGGGSDARAVDPDTIDWNKITARNFPYRVRQRPGPTNPMGMVKFMFPNRYNVYIHDTPRRHLFAEARRTFSSGCVRLQSPLKLADLILSTQKDWSMARIAKLIRSGKRQVVYLKDRVPVHLYYLTAWVDASGTVHFRNDVYNRDRQKVSALGSLPPVSRWKARVVRAGD